MPCIVQACSINSSTVFKEQQRLEVLPEGNQAQCRFNSCHQIQMALEASLLLPNRSCKGVQHHDSLQSRMSQIQH